MTTEERLAGLETECPCYRHAGVDYCIPCQQFQLEDTGVTTYEIHSPGCTTCAGSGTVLLIPGLRLVESVMDENPHLYAKEIR